MNYPRTLGSSLKYASQVFDGELFHHEQLQKIQSNELDSYLYGDEDFVSQQCGRKVVKLGGLIITYTKKGMSSCIIQIIDFHNRRLKFGFALNLEGNSWLN